jgi:hypothetical protein
MLYLVIEQTGRNGDSCPTICGSRFFALCIRRFIMHTLMALPSRTSSLIMSGCERMGGQSS